MSTTSFQATNPDFAAAVHDSFARQGLMRTLGARLATVEPGFCIVELQFTPALSQQDGFFHGGAIGAIADTAAGYAAYSLMPAGAEILTVDYKLSLIRPAMPPILRAEARVLRAGKTLTMCRAEVRCEGGDGADTCAVLQSTLIRR
jgi:uncharacterized protein (TIGR00369 family)